MFPFGHFQLSTFNVVGVPRIKIDWIVTEYGRRCLRFGMIEERARAMIELAVLNSMNDYAN